MLDFFFGANSIAGVAWRTLGGIASYDNLDWVFGTERQIDYYSNHAPIGQYGLIYWLPQIVKGVATDIGLDKITGVSINALTGYLVAVPFAFATVAMIWWARRSDVTRERVWHVVFPAVISGLSLIASAYLGNPLLAAITLTICAMGLYAAAPPFWTLPTGFLTGSAAAGGHCID